MISPAEDLLMSLLSDRDITELRETKGELIEMINEYYIDFAGKIVGQFMDHHIWTREEIGTKIAEFLGRNGINGVSPLSSRSVTRRIIRNREGAKSAVNDPIY